MIFIVTSWSSLDCWEKLRFAPVAILWTVLGTAFAGLYDKGNISGHMELLESSAEIVVHKIPALSFCNWQVV